MYSGREPARAFVETVQGGSRDLIEMTELENQAHESDRCICLCEGQVGGDKTSCVVNVNSSFGDRRIFVRGTQTRDLHLLWIACAHSTMNEDCLFARASQPVHGGSRALTEIAEPQDLLPDHAIADVKNLGFSFFTVSRLRGIFWPARPEDMPVFAAANHTHDPHRRAAAVAAALEHLSIADCTFGTWMLQLRGRHNLV